MSVTGEGPGRPPVKVGAPVSDITAGILGALGVVSAHVHKMQTGEGQRVDTSLFEAAITHTYWQSAITFATGNPPGPMGSAHPLNAPYQALRTSDGWVNIGAANQANWLRLIAVLEAPELAEDQRFSENSGRMAHLEELTEALEKHTIARSTDDWLAKFEEAGLPAGPVLDIGQMHRDPQTIAREMVVEADHARLGPVKTIGLPIKFSGTPGGVVAGAPTYGQHTSEVLSEYGYDADEIEALAASGAVAAA